MRSPFSKMLFLTNKCWPSLTFFVALQEIMSNTNRINDIFAGKDFKQKKLSFKNTSFYA
tara:strand:- start:801 stop:977 length:177 start_codon:yes stop_codon:yes gene_type:complete